MRMAFRTLTRPKHLAERIEIVFPALSHMQAQNWAAQILGYRNWHELANLVSPDAEETPDFVVSIDDLLAGKNKDNSQAFFKRSGEQQKVLERLIGYPVSDMPTLFFHINPNYPDVRYKKLGKTGKGAPAFKGFAYDLFSREGEAPGIGGGRGDTIGYSEDADDDDDSGLYTYLGLPEAEDEEEFLSRLALKMRKSNIPFNGYDRYLVDALRGTDFGVTSLTVEPNESSDDEDQQSASQFRRYRFFILDNHQPAGAAVLWLDASASSGSNSVHVTVTVDEAWSFHEDDDVLESLAMQMAQEVCVPLSRLTWFRVGNPEMDIHVSFESESESELTWYLVEALKTLVPDLLSEDMDENGMSALSFSCSICP